MIETPEMTFVSTLTQDIIQKIDKMLIHEEKIERANPNKINETGETDSKFVAEKVSCPKWSDDLLFQLNQADFFPAKPNPKKAKEILYTFFKFYFDGTVPKNTSIIDLLFSAIILLPVRHDNYNLFPDSYYSSTQKNLLFQVPNYTMPSDFTSYNLKKLLQIRFPQQHYNLCQDQRFSRYKDNDQQKFHSEIVRLLTLKEPSAELKRAASFLALTLVRSIIKHMNSIFFAMSKTKYKETFELMTGIKTFCPPCHDAFKLVNRKIYCDHNNDNTIKFKKMFTKIVSIYVYFVKHYITDLHYLRAAILCHMEFFGMETVHLVIQAEALLTNKSLVKCPYTLEELTKFPCTVDSWKIINEFHKDYDIKPISIYYARLIDLSYFEELDAMNNYELCGMISILVNVNQGYDEFKDKSKKGVLYSCFMAKEYLLDYAKFHKEELKEQMYSKDELLSVFAQTPEHPFSQDIVQSRVFLTGNVILQMEELRNFKMEEQNKNWIEKWIHFKQAQMESAVLFGRGLYFKITNGIGISQKDVKKYRVKFQNYVFKKQTYL